MKPSEALLRAARFSNPQHSSVARLIESFCLRECGELLWHGLSQHLILAQHSRLPSWYAFKLHSHLQSHSWSSGPLVGFPLPEQEVNLYISRPLPIFLIMGSNYNVLPDWPPVPISLSKSTLFFIRQLKYILFSQRKLIHTYSLLHYYYSY